MTLMTLMIILSLLTLLQIYSLILNLLLLTILLLLILILILILILLRIFLLKHTSLHKIPTSFSTILLVLVETEISIFILIFKIIFNRSIFGAHRVILVILNSWKTLKKKI
jgi:hypothetical protein